MNEIRTKEIAEAAVFHVHGIQLSSYEDRYWIFNDEENLATDLKLRLVNKQVKVEPLEFLDAVRRVKAFSNRSVK